MAGFGICMKTAGKQTKRMSDALTQRMNDEDGAVEALQ
jgi:hydroxymethylpyrimidine pyrophosphatase-like HAD family hydrolase